MGVGWEAVWRKWEKGKEWEFELVCIMKKGNLLSFFKKDKKTKKKTL